MLKLLKNPCFRYTMLWCLYYTQGVLYPSGSIISQSVALLILLLSLLYTYKYLSLCRLQGYAKALFCVLMLVTLYGCIAYVTEGTVITGKTSNTRLFSWYRNMYLSILPVFSYLYFAKTRLISRSLVIRMIPIILVAVLMSYYWSYQTAINLTYLKTGNEVEDVTNNAGYIVLSMIPLLLFFDNKKLIQYVGLLLCILLVMLAMKRGAMLVCGILTIAFVFRELKQSSTRVKILIIFLSISLSLILYYFIQDYLTNNLYFMTRMDDIKEGNSSGRDVIYSTLWSHFITNADVRETLFGGGVWYTTKLCYTAAHNDWLEFLLDMGLFGVAVYAYYWLSFFQLARKSTLPEASRFCVLLIFINLFMKTIFSMSLESITFIQSMMLGMAFYGLISDNDESNYSWRFRTSRASC